MIILCSLFHRTEKRIICVFRGSKSGGKDWATNKKLLKKKLDNIKDAKTDLGLKEFGHVGLHYGWASKFLCRDIFFVEIVF